MAPELFAATAIFTVLGLHPFTTYPASLALLARLRPRQHAAAPELSPRRAALCVCAYNEAGIIRAKAENMLQTRAASPGLDLLLYVDAATDGTAEILHDYQDRIRVVVAAERHGKSHGMNTLVAATDADIVIFSDANVMFAADAVPNLLAAFADPDIGCVCGQLVYRVAADSATAAMGSLYWRLEERIKALETRTGSTMGADGSIFAIRRVLHHRPPPDIIDDLFVSLAILCDGHRVVREPAALAVEETVSRPSEEFRRKIRIACQAFNVHRQLRPRLRRLGALDRYKYLSHKLLRWFSGVSLALAAVSFLCGLAALAAWIPLSVCLGAGLVTLATGLLRPSSVPGRLVDIAGAFAATSIGVFRSLRGDRFQTWTPPASARSGALSR